MTTRQDIAADTLAELRPAAEAAQTPEPSSYWEHKRPTVEQLADAQGLHAYVIAKTIRNALEELHGGNVEDSLTDEQMAKINPILRNSVLSALVTMELIKWGDRGAANVWNFAASSIPSYWEAPELDDDYEQDIRGLDRDLPAGMAGTIKSLVLVDSTDCRNCGQPIFQISGPLGPLFGEEKWKHKDELRSRNCRTASYDRENRPQPWYDTSLPVAAKATPPREGPSV